MPNRCGYTVQSGAAPYIIGGVGMAIGFLPKFYSDNKKMYIHKLRFKGPSNTTIYINMPSNSATPFTNLVDFHNFLLKNSATSTNKYTTNGVYYGTSLIAHIVQVYVSGDTIYYNYQRYNETYMYSTSTDKSTSITSDTVTLIKGGV